VFIVFILFEFTSMDISVFSETRSPYFSRLPCFPKITLSPLLFPFFCNISLLHIPYFPENFLIFFKNILTYSPKCASVLSRESTFMFRSELLQNHDEYRTLIILYTDEIYSSVKFYFCQQTFSTAFYCKSSRCGV